MQKGLCFTLYGVPLSELCPKIWTEGQRSEVRVESKTQGGERGIILVDIQTEIQQGVSTSLYMESNVWIWVGGGDGGEIKPELCLQLNIAVMEIKK